MSDITTLFKLKDFLHGVATTFKDNKTPLLVVGNKSDLEESELSIKQEDIKKFLKEFKAFFKIFTINCSAKSGENVENVIKLITKLAV